MPTSQNPSKPLPSRRKPFWKRLTRRLQGIDFWRVLVALLLALTTCFVIRVQRANSSYAAWRIIPKVPVVVAEKGSRNDIYIPSQIFSVDLVVSVDLLRQGDTIAADDFAIELDERRLAVAFQAAQNSAFAPGPIQEVEYHVQLSDIVRKPDGVEIREIRSARHSVRCERVVEREVPIHLNLDRTQQVDGWTYECQLLSPVVRLSGPASVVNGILAIETDPILLKDTKPYSGMIQLQNPSGGLLHFMRNQVEYKVSPQRDSKEVVTRAFNALPVSFLTRGDTRLQPLLSSTESPQVSIHLTGPSRLLKSMSPEQLRVICDLTPYTLAGGQSVRLHVFGLPDGVRVVEILPKPVLKVELGYPQSIESPRTTPADSKVDSPATPEAK